LFGLDFAAPERVRFRTKLEGLDINWIDAGERRIADYPPLPPGDYRFRVIAGNQAGLWNETGAALTFRQVPFFWQTWWFRAGCMMFAAIAIAGTVFLASRRRWHRRLERLEMQLSLERERARIAQDIHDGVGANLTEIAWLAEVTEKVAVNPEEVRTQSQKISGTARATVQLFDEIVWAVLPKNDTLTSLVQYLGRRVDEWFDNSPTRCWFTAPRELPDFVVPAEARHGFYLACKEALHNVNKHAHATEVQVQVTVDDSTLRVSIADNGRGFDPATVVEGHGLHNLKQRFQKLGGQFELHSQPGHGTRIQMSIALKPAQHR
jgi:signal transduction histidine kinase